MRLIIVSGLSGSGKSVALNLLEDAGFYCIDNIPAALLGSVISTIVATGDAFYDNLAVGVDARSRAADLAALPELIGQLRGQGMRCEVLFLHADEQSLLRRYAESRRPHPLAAAGMSLREAIAREKELLGPVISCAELIIDTSHSSVYELRDMVRNRVGLHTGPGLSILVESFGYKNGIPPDADLVFDLRCLPNPHWESALRPLTGQDAPVIDYLERSPLAQQLFTDIRTFIERWIPHFDDFNRNYLTVALGCTGGQHRSVYLAEKLAAALREKHPQVLIRHRELRGLAPPAADLRTSGA